MSQLGREQLFFRITVFFAIATAVIGVCNLAMAGAFTIEDMSVFSTQTVPGQNVSIGGTGFGTGAYTEGANTANGTVISSIDFTTAGTVNSNVTTLIGTWTPTAGSGLVLTQNSFDKFLPGTVNAVVYRNVRSTGNVYTVSSRIDNVPGEEYYIFARFVTGISGSDIKIVFASDGVHVKKLPLYLGILDNGDDYFYPLPNAQITIPGGSVITTVLTETVSSQTSNIPDYTSILTVSKDGEQLFTIPTRSILPGVNINDQVRHGGAGSDFLGFILMGITAPMLDSKETIASGTGPIAVFTAASSRSTDPLSIFTEFMTLIAIAVGLSNNSLIPFWLSSIIIVPCISTLSYMGLELLRGT